MNFPIQNGDVLLYSHKGFFDFLIREFTRSQFTHVECVSDAASGMVVASRNGIGPNLFAFDNTVVKILRPKSPINMVSAMQWFNQSGVRGCGYGYWDLSNFLPQIAKHIPQSLKAKGMICSTLVDKFLQAGSFSAFADMFDAGEVTPRDFDESAMFTPIWQKV